MSTEECSSGTLATKKVCKMTPIRGKRSINHVSKHNLAEGRPSKSDISRFLNRQIFCKGRRTAVLPLLTLRQAFCEGQHRLRFDMLAKRSRRATVRRFHKPPTQPFTISSCTVEESFMHRLLAPQCTTNSRDYSLSTMRWLTISNFLGALIAAACGYILALSLHVDDFNMTAPLRTQILPRLSHLSAHLSSSRSFLPAVQKPLAFLSSGTSAYTRQNSFSTTTKMTHDTMILKDAVEHRRTIYQLTKKSTIPDAKIKEIVEAAIKHVPSSFNSQSARLVVLLKDEHDKFWDIVRDILKGMVPEESWESTGNRIAGFKNAYGTVSTPVTFCHMNKWLIYQYRYFSTKIPRT